MDLVYIWTRLYSIVMKWYETVICLGTAYLLYKIGDSLVAEAINGRSKRNRGYRGRCICH